ncbi:MAG: SPASM domain-containing protein [Candidatus Saliniplasma sp.]
MLFTIIGMDDNIKKVVKTAELAVSLGTDSIMFNRVNLGGRSVRDTGLYPDKKALSEALNGLNHISKRYGIMVHCGVPIPPCVVDPDDYPKISFGRCPAGIDRSYFTVESSGDLRTCNHSPRKMINVLEDDFHEIFETKVWEDFVGTFPERCEGCRHLDSCKSSCRAAGYVESGEWGSLDPFVKYLSNRPKDRS